MQDKLIEIPRFDWEGRLKVFVQNTSKQDPYLLQRLKALGLPSDGLCRLTSTPGRVYDVAYTDFTVQSIAVLLGNRDDLDTDKLGGVLHLSAPKDEKVRVWRVWLMDITRNEPDQDSCIRYMWNEVSNGALVTIESINNDLRRFTIAGGTGNGTRNVIAQVKRLLPGLKIISLEEANSGLGRPEGTGWFKSVKDFRAALKAVLAAQVSRPIQLQALKLLDDHELCQLKPQRVRTQSHTKLLRHWLHKAKIKDYDEALRRYWKPSKKRK